MAKTTTKLSSIDAQKIVDDLEVRRADSAAQAAADQREIESIALAAHTGDQRAAAKLETIRERELRRQLDLTGIDAALTAAKRNVEAAKATEDAAEMKQNAEEAKVVVDRIDSLFASADTHFKQAMDALAAADKRIEELHRLGFTFPTAIQVRTNALFALETYLMALPQYWWRELAHGSVRYLAPHHRRSFSKFWTDVSTNLSREIANRLGESTNKERGAA